MDLIIRPLRLDELIYCSSIIRDRFAYGQDELAGLVGLWRWLTAGDCAIAEVMEDRSAPVGEPLAYFSITVFLKDDFARSLQAKNRSIVSKLVLNEWSRGRNPVMTSEEIRQANSRGGSGVTLLCLSSGGPRMHPLRMDERSIQILHELTQWLLRSHSGYRLKELLLETFGPAQFEWAASMGLDVRLSSLGSSLPNQSQHGSCLFGMNRQEAAKAGVGNSLGRIFAHKDPIFFFSPPEQQQLISALDGLGDAAIAQRLFISLSAVHKRWRTIFDKVWVAAPGLLPALAEIGPEGSPVRGAEKRSVLLQYIRRHPEELRPVRSRTSRATVWEPIYHREHRAPPVHLYARNVVDRTGGIAFDQLGRLWACTAGKIIVFDPQSGRVLGSISQEGGAPGRITFDQHGKVYVAKPLDRKLLVYNAHSLALEASVPCPGVRRLYGVAVGAYGEIYVVDSCASGSLTAIDMHGDTLQQAFVDSTGTHFHYPGCVAVHGNKVYVGTGPDFEKNAVYSYDIAAFLAGKPLAPVEFLESGHTGPSGIVADAAGDLYVSNRYSNSLVKFSPTGETLLVIDKETLCCEGVAVSDCGEIYVANEATGAITVYRPDGKLIRVLG